LRGRRLGGKRKTETAGASTGQAIEQGVSTRMGGVTTGQATLAARDGWRGTVPGGTGSLFGANATHMRTQMTRSERLADAGCAGAGAGLFVGTHTSVSDVAQNGSETGFAKDEGRAGGGTGLGQGLDSAQVVVATVFVVFARRNANRLSEGIGRTSVGDGGLAARQVQTHAAGWTSDTVARSGAKSICQRTGARAVLAGCVRAAQTEQIFFALAVFATGGTDFACGYDNVAGVVAGPTRPRYRQRHPIVAGFFQCDLGTSAFALGVGQERACATVGGAAVARRAGGKDLPAKRRHADRQKHQLYGQRGDAFAPGFVGGKRQLCTAGQGEKAEDSGRLAVVGGDADICGVEVFGRGHFERRRQTGPDDAGGKDPQTERPERPNSRRGCASENHHSTGSILRSRSRKPV
jgi:hypothetical protein